MDARRLLGRPTGKRSSPRESGTAASGYAARVVPRPMGAFALRYWDGHRWTAHGSARGPQAAAYGASSAFHPRALVSDPKVQRQVQKVGIHAPGAAQAAIFHEPILVVNQKAKLIGNRADYEVFDQHGRQIATVREVDRRLRKKIAGAAAQHMDLKFQVLDMDGQLLISLTRPAKLVRSRMIVVGPGGVRGEILQKNTGAFGKVRFALESQGREIGTMLAESWNAWDFTIQDESRHEIGRITKTWAGWTKERFTNADNYVVHVHRTLDEPLRSLVVATALAVDTALKQGRPTHSTGRKVRYK